jgi:mannitol/fructose-specific phosphotransferase system IIA component (Ntr-type)
MMVISDYIENVFFDLTASDKLSCILEMSERIRKATPLIPDFSKRIIDREKQRSSSLRHGIAFPRAYAPEIPYVLGGVAIFKKPIKWDDEPTNIVFLVVADPRLSRIYMKLILSVSRLLSSSDVRQILAKSQTKDEVLKCLGISY